MALRGIQGKPVGPFASNVPNSSDAKLYRALKLEGRRQEYGYEFVPDTVGAGTAYPAYALALPPQHFGRDALSITAKPKEVCSPVNICRINTPNCPQIRLAELNATKPEKLYSEMTKRSSIVRDRLRPSSTRSTAVPLWMFPPVTNPIFFAIVI